MRAVGVIETLGYAAAIYAADAALKAANVQLIGIESVIGVGGKLGVTVQFSGEVAAVQSAVASGKAAAETMGTVFSAHVIPNPHDDVKNNLLPIFKLPGDTASNEAQTINGMDVVNAVREKQATDDPAETAPDTVERSSLPPHIEQAEDQNTVKKSRRSQRGGNNQ